MKTTALSAPGEQTSLLATLQQAHFKVAMLMLLALGFALSLAAFMALRASAQHNLQRVASSIAYTTEAAVAVKDTMAIQAALSHIAAQESLVHAHVLDAKGAVLGQYRRNTNSLLNTVGDCLASLLLTQPTTAAVVVQGKQIGEVRLRGDGSGFVWLLFTGLAGALVCLALGGLAMRQLSRRVLRDVVQPLQALIAVAHAARQERPTQTRAPASKITELHQLGEDLNALLEEIEAHQTQRQQEDQPLSHLANHDSLTGLPNRAYFRRRLSRVLQDNQTEGSGLAVLYLDNDHFKSVNDRYGHATGDALLVEVAKRVRAQIRETDVLARLGGDEFAVLLAPLHNIEDATRISDKIIASMAEPLVQRPADRIVPSLSIGIAIYPVHGQTAEQLLRAADSAMYRVKTQQRGQRHIARTEADTSDLRESL
ncbi:diguanylate cyclase (GGDEF) domain-containing protein [Rhodoferax sp. OV413]|uniref:diguanylate cyclase domain-containing protein n=1 Tax=Rhodoferax sp. OV413 TaxID=1855285 RepID=UPI0008889C43|nr:diguanylate cyclase [Rhodoferax sp. OV413]SDP70763.1 diguanylate cyclase (GGDEF) domain-containing protein [Rhodoferax sp. OV413]